MKLVELAKGLDNGVIPMAKNTIYKWSYEKRYPKLIIKVCSKLFWDTDEWESMAKESRDHQVEESGHLRPF